MTTIYELPEVVDDGLAHSLTLPSRYREAARDPFVEDAHGHGGIDDGLLPLLRAHHQQRGSADPDRAARTEVDEIYFGNWQRDNSQFIGDWLAAKVSSDTARRLLGEVLFRFVAHKAQGRWGRGIDPGRLGAYRWEEHIDNPRDFGGAVDPLTYRVVRGTPQSEPTRFPALWMEDPRTRLQRYIIMSHQYVLGQVGAALRAGPTRDGRELLGNALHTVEDFYAHSNFCELAIGQIHMEAHGSVPAGLDLHCGRENTQSRSPLKDSMGRWRLTTGVFTMLDALTSLLKNNLLKLEEHGAAGRLVEGRLHAIAEDLARNTGRGVYDGIIEESHSILAKDDPSRPNHPLARALAISSAQAFYLEMQRAWDNHLSGGATRFGGLVLERMNHPLAAGTWWKPVVHRFVAVAPAPPGTPPGGPRSGGGATALRRGSRGPAVVRLQHRLNTWLTATGRRPLLNADGIFGMATRAAVVAFQQSRGIIADGIAGPGTLASLPPV